MTHTLTDRDLIDAVAWLRRRDRETTDRVVFTQRHFANRFPETFLESLPIRDRVFIAAVAFGIGNAIANTDDEQAEIERILGRFDGLRSKSEKESRKTQDDAE